MTKEKTSVLDSFAFDGKKAKEEVVKRKVLDVIEKEHSKTFNPRAYARITKADYLKSKGIDDETVRELTWTEKALTQYNEQ